MRKLVTSVLFLSISMIGISAYASTDTPDKNVNAEIEVIEKLNRLNLLLSNHDPAILNEFALDSDVVLLGSDADELAIGPEQLAQFFKAILSLPLTLSWDWKQTKVSVHGEVAWVFAQGDSVSHSRDGIKRTPYRLTGVLVHQDGKWLWKQFHGSVPGTN
jgi:ketosteroid isomerase-like protein